MIVPFPNINYKIEQVLAFVSVPELELLDSQPSFEEYVLVENIWEDKNKKMLQAINNKSWEEIRDCFVNPVGFLVLLTKFSPDYGHSICEVRLYSKKPDRAF